MKMLAGHAYHLDAEDADESNSERSEKSFCFDFPNFVELPHNRGDKVLSPFVSCLGFTWQLTLRPGGHEQSSKKETYVSIYLRCVGAPNNATETPFMRFLVRVLGRTGKPKKVFDTSVRFSISPCLGKGAYDFMKRSDVLDPTDGYLDGDGTFSVYVVLQEVKRKFWRPSRGSKHDDLRRLLDTPEGSDVTFVVGGREVRAHRCILFLRAPTLFDMIQDSEGTIDLPDSITDPTLFKDFLRIIYGNQTPDSKLLAKSGIELLKIADRFGCTRTKLMIESELAETVLDETNAAGLLPVADALSCALLKEAAIDMFKSHHEAVMKSAGWKTLAESASLLEALLRAKCRQLPRTMDSSGRDGGGARDGGGDNSFDHLSVSSLREKLEEAGLDVDGTRETLVKRLLGTQE